MLVKQKLTVPLTEGLNTKADDRFLLPGEVKTLENGVYRKTGRIDKKFGFTNMTKNIYGGGTLADAKGIYTLDNELLCESGDRLYSYSQELNAWVDKGSLIRTTLSTQEIVRTTSQQGDLQFTTIGDIRCFSWSDSRGGIRYSVQDTVTGTYFVYDTEISSNGNSPEVISHGTTFTVFYRVSETIRYRQISTSTPGTLSSETTLISDVSSTTVGAFDVLTCQGDVYLAYHFNASDILKVRKYAGGNFASASASADFSDVDIDYAITIVSSTVSGTSRIHVGSGSNSLGTVIRILDTSLSTIIQEEFTASISPRFMTGVQISSSSHNVQWVWTNNYSLTFYENQITMGIMGPSGIVSDTEPVKRNFRLVTEAFSVNDTVYFGMVNTQDPQITLFIVDTDYNIVAKIAPGEASLNHTGSTVRLSSVEVSNQQFMFAYGKKGERNRDGYSFGTIDFGTLTSASSATLNEVLYLSSGLLKIYDGVSVFEEGFAYYPTIDSAAISIGEGDVADGVYQYVCTYEWLDNQGNLHRSAPSIPFELEISTGPGPVLVTVDNLCLTEKSLYGRSPVKIVLWRTTGEGGSTGTTFYRVDEVDNLPDIAYQSFLDTYSDASLASQEILYTSGGVLENIQAPANTIVIPHNKHLIIAGLEDGSAARVSKPAFKDEAPGFNEALELRMPSEGGRISCAASMDDKIVFFKANSCYFSVGEGPDVFGSNLYSQPQLISDTIGCPDRNGAVLTPAGILFRSENGIYLLTRGLALEPIGHPVEDFNTSTVSDIVKIIGEDEIRVCTTDGNVLVYNYDENKWSIFTNREAAGSTVYQNIHYVVDDTGQVSYEDSSTYLDNTAFVPLKVTTGWLSLDEIAGLQRIYKVQVIGDYHTPHKLTLDISYDENPAVVETHQLELTADPKQYIYEARPRRQKFSSVQYTIRDAAPTSSTGTGQGFTISGLRLVVGLKKRLSNVPNTRRI